MRIRPGGWCWGVAIGGIAAMDIWLLRNGHDPMTQVYADALGHPYLCVPALVFWIVLTLHLMKKYLPAWYERVDLISILVKLAALRMVNETITAAEDIFATE